jgi:hypothetical protein
MPIREVSPPARERPGEEGRKGKIAAQGGLRGVADLAGLVDLGLNALTEVGARLGIGPNLGQPFDAASAVDRPVGTRGTQDPGGLSQRLTGETLQPQGIGENALAAVSRGAAAAAPFAAAAPVAAGARALGLGAGRAATGAGLRAAGGRAGLELATGAAGETSARTAEALGAGAPGQVAASVAGGFSLPRIGQRAGSALGQVALKPVRHKVARRLARETLGAEIPDRVAAVKQLDKLLDTPIIGKGTTAQELQIPGVFGLEQNLSQFSKRGASLRNDVFKLRRQNAVAAEEVAKTGWPAGQPGAAVETYLDNLEKVSRNVEKAYKGVGHLEGIPTIRLKAAAAFVTQDAGQEGIKQVPMEQVELISRYADTNDLKRIQGLRRALGDRLRGAKRDPERNTEVFYLNKIIDAVETTLDEAAVAGGSRQINALARARRLAADKAKRFDKKSTLNKVLGDDFQNMQGKFGNFLRTAKKPADELDLMRGTLAGDPDAWKGVQRLMREEVFPNNVEDLFNNDSLLSLKGIKRSTALLKLHEKSWEAVFGPGSARSAKLFLERARLLATGKVGTAAEMAQTSSRGVPIGTLIENAASVGDLAKGKMISALARVVKMVGGKLPSTLDEADEVLMNALIDPMLAKGLLEELPEAAVSRWVERYRSVLRQTARGTGSALSNQTQGGSTQ